MHVLCMWEVLSECMVQRPSTFARALYKWVGKAYTHSFTACVGVLNVLDQAHSPVCVWCVACAGVEHIVQCMSVFGYTRVDTESSLCICSHICISNAWGNAWGNALRNALALCKRQDLYYVMHVVMHDVMHEVIHYVIVGNVKTVKYALRNIWRNTLCMTSCMW